MRFLSDLAASRGPAAAFAALGLFWGGFAALVPALKPQAGLSDAGFGLAMLVSTCGAVLAMWLAPAVDARLGGRALPVLVAAMALAFLLPGLSTTGTAFALTMALAAAACGLLDVVMNARVADLEAAGRRPLMSLNHALYSLTYAASAIGTGLAREAGAGPFAVFATLSAVGLALIPLAVRAPLPQAEGAAPGHAAAGGRILALVLPAGLIVLIGFMAEQATEGWSALHLERNLGAGAAAGALGPALLGLTMGAGRLWGQSLARRLSEATLIRGGAIVSAIGALIAAASPTPALAYVGFATLGAGVSVVVPMAFARAGRQVPPNRRARAISRLSLIGYAGFFAGPPLMGFLSEAVGLGGAFVAIAALLLLIPAVLVPWMKAGATS
ncbi:MFS transporter [Salipiger sp.]|uniref:MFS transporter n=1 Tax=Salipiger sp. TaxID=2078585 RepID=UPI003A9885E3